MSDPNKQEQTTAVVHPPLAGKERAEAVEAPGLDTLLRPALLAPGDTVADRYTVLQLLGQGGMGVVLAAYDVRLDRRIALKLVQPQRSESQALRARLLREAQAMARLSHPNVVHVYDTGALEDGRLFIAMEYVEGQTLSQWYVEEPRSWRELLDLFLAAGRGLAAAHAAGLVHRDFKPDNVLVGHDGRVRVTDFGVARADQTEALSTGSTPPPLSAGTWESALTLPGTLLGTPRYMAPELLAGQQADERSDLFSFCIALYEALYGQSPFGGSNLQERAQAMVEGRLTPLPARSEVPAWVSRALLQGLQVQPGLRPPSMRALIALLEDDPEVRRRARLRVAGLLVGAVALSGLAVAGWLQGQARGSDCTHLERELTGVWDAPLKARVQQRLLGTGLPYARDTSQRVASLLEDYAGTWVRMRTAVCKAEQARASYPHALSVLQVRCLERRRSRMRALTELLARGGDEELLPKAVQAAQSLPPLADCENEKALMGAVPPPEDMALRAQVEALQERVDRLATLESAGQYTEGLALLEALLPQARALDHAPLLTQVLYWQAMLQEKVGAYQEAEAAAREAIAQASRGGEAALEAHAWNLLGLVVLQRQVRVQEAPSLMLAMESAAERARDERLRADSFANKGNAYASMGRYEEAKAWHERALALRLQLLGAEHYDISSSYHNLGIVLQRMGRYEDSLSYFERALALRRKVLGPEHPVIANQLNNLGLALQSLGRFAQAEAQFSLAISLQQRLLGPEHPHLAAFLSNLGAVALDMERYPQAVAHFERALALRRKLLGQEHPEVAVSLGNLGLALMGLGQYTEARGHFEQALALQRKHLEPEHPYVASSLHNLGVVLMALGRYSEARAHLEQALALRQGIFRPESLEVAETLCALGRTLVHLQQWSVAQRHLEQALSLHEAVVGQQHVYLAPSLLGLGELLLAQGRPAQAVPQLERALALSSSGEVLLTLAQALWTAGKDRPRALALARQAQAHYQQLGHPPGARAAAQWLAAHPLP